MGVVKKYITTETALTTQVWFFHRFILKGEIDQLLALDTGHPVRLSWA
jgi:hypothetical protein